MEVLFTCIYEDEEKSHCIRLTVLKKQVLFLQDKTLRLCENPQEQREQKDPL